MPLQEVVEVEQRRQILPLGQMALLAFLLMLILMES
jgi:hypothetical protein